MNCSRQHTDQHHGDDTARVLAKPSEPTPTESLIGYDGDGVPPADGPSWGGVHVTFPGKLLPPKPIRSDPLASRCACCGWVYAKEASEGCVPGDCSQRPLPERKYDPERYAKETGFTSGTRPAVTQGEILRAHGHQSPAVQPRDLDALDKLLEPLRAPRHACAGCGITLDAPGYCFRCLEEIEGEDQSLRQGTPWWVWLLIGSIVTVIAQEAVRLVFG